MKLYRYWIQNWKVNEEVHDAIYDEYFETYLDYKQDALTDLDNLNSNEMQYNLDSCGYFYDHPVADLKSIVELDMGIVREDREKALQDYQEAIHRAYIKGKELSVLLSKYS